MYLCSFNPFWAIQWYSCSKCANILYVFHHTTCFTELFKTHLILFPRCYSLDRLPLAFCSHILVCAGAWPVFFMLFVLSRFLLPSLSNSIHICMVVVSACKDFLIISTCVYHSSTPPKFTNIEFICV